MERWQISFNWEQQGDEAVQIRDVRTRVLTDMAWVSMKAYDDMGWTYENRAWHFVFPELAIQTLG
ncbi:hypothetical protein Dimus_007396 [Dionaea muscipula]